MISMRLRRLYRRLSYLTGSLRDRRPGMQGSMPLACKRVPEPVGVVAAVAEQPLRLGQIVQQGCRAGIVADLACGHEEAQGAAVGIADGMKLGVHPAFGAADQAAKTPFLTRRLDAVRCALR